MENVSWSWFVTAFKRTVSQILTVNSQVPGLMAAKDMDETLALLSKEAEVLHPIETIIMNPYLTLTI